MSETENSVFDEVAKLLADYTGSDFKIEPETLLEDERLNIDSLDKVEVVIMLEGQFNIEISDQEADNLTTVADVVRLVEAKRSNG